MQNYVVRLESEIFKTYRCTRAANSLDIDQEKKSIHELKISADLSGDFNIILIVGASGSGKTTLAKKIFGEDCFKDRIDLSLPIIDQLPKNLSYDECAQILSGVGLTSVPCWIRPAYTLSNGQRARAEAALAMCEQADVSVIDEWTSVVDRTVAKVMSHCVSKFAKKQNKKICLLSCHYDVIEWIDPDLIIDCNRQEFIDRRSLQPEQRKRKEKLRFEIRKVDRKTWPMFSKYHYLNEKMPGGKIECFGMFIDKEQIGFICFANYKMRRTKFEKLQMHTNRLVIHPDYVGFGLGMKLSDATSQMMLERGFDVRTKFSSIPSLRARQKTNYWKLIKVEKKMGQKKNIIMRKHRETMRSNVTTYSFKFLGIPKPDFVAAFRSDFDESKIDLEHLISP